MSIDPSLAPESANPIEEYSSRYCLRCGYPLVAQTENRCPECGDSFDPNNPDSYRERPMRKPQPVILLLAVYLMPFVLNSLLLTVIGTGKWHRRGHWPPMDARITCSLIAGTGPFAWLDVKWTQAFAALLVAATWLLWFAIVIGTPLRRAPLWLHLPFSLLWSCCGCMRIAIWI